ncbi:MAG: glycosyltransferase [Bergeyella sp.]
MKVLVSVFNNLITDQRVEKICRTLFENGYEVELIGNDWGGIPEMERPYPFEHIRLRSKSLKTAYPEFNVKLYRKILEKADKNTILLCNDLDILTANYWASKKLKIPFIYDSHEIYTEMPAVQGRFTQKIWRKIEKKIIPEVRYMMTASESYADWFEKNYHIPKPVVVQNFPRKIVQEQQFGDSEEKIIMYQGAINPSRGLDKIISAMRKLENAKLYIAGAGPKLSEYQELSKKNGVGDKVVFLGRINPEELREITRNADVGLSIEENNGLSYYFSLPNKVSDYIQARVPVVVSGFPEMKKIVSEYRVGEIIENHSEEELVGKIQTVLSNGKSFYKKQLETASENLCWEKEEPKILEVFSKVVRETFRT